MFFWGEAGRVRVANKERNKVTTMWEIQAQGKNHQGASVCTAVTDRLTNTAKDITAFTQSWGFPQKVRAGLGSGGPGLCYLSRGVRGRDETGGEGVCRRLQT